MSAETLVRMANQIAAFFRPQGEAKAIAGTADHIRQFWDPRMRRAIVSALAGKEADGLDPIARAAIATLPPVPERRRG